MKASTRIFASEFNSSDLIFEQPSDKSRVMITPGGACCSEVFIAGALIERGGTPGGGQYVRVADPTGAFSMQIDRNQRQQGDILRGMEPPLFVTVLGSLIIHGGERESSCSVAIRDIRTADRMIRDSWIVRTAELTCGRLELMMKAIGGERVPDCTARAMDHYRMNLSRVTDLADMVSTALEGVLPAEAKDAEGGDPQDIVLSIIREKGGKNGIHIQDIIPVAGQFGLGEDAVRHAVKALLAEDECYQPSRDFVKIL